jgi:hypothetical protein
MNIIIESLKAPIGNNVWRVRLEGEETNRHTQDFAKREDANDCAMELLAAMDSGEIKEASSAT